MDESQSALSGRPSKPRQRPRPRQRTGSSTGGRLAGAGTRSADGDVSEMAVSTKAPTRPRPRHTEPAPPLPNDVFEILVNALADALVLDYQHDTDAMVDSPRRKDGDAETRGA